MAGLRWLNRVSGAALALSGSTLLVNLLWFRQPRGELPTDAPRVSVLVPARNEARNIGPCVRSLLAQSYPNFELLVLDDGSGDETDAILHSIQQAHTGQPTFRILSGKPLPLEWGGKNWACYQLAQAADPPSRFLLFTDADTTHAPDALRRVVAEMERDNLALLSLMPEQQMGSWMERLVVSLLPLQILGYLPLPAMEWLPFPTVAAANGQYLLFRRAAYAAFNGHAAFPSHLADDVLLAQQVKTHGGNVRLANGAGLVRCRMYQNGDEVIAGFRRSFAAGLRLESKLITILILFNLLAYTLPFLRASFSAPARFQSVTVLFLRLLLAWRTQTPLHTAFTHPLGIMLTLWIQFLSVTDVLRGNQTAWRGRHYEVRGTR